MITEKRHWNFFLFRSIFNSENLEVKKVLRLKVDGGIITVPSNKHLSSEDLKMMEDEKKIFESHKRYLSAILRKDGRKIKVNWFEYASIVKSADYRIRHDIERYINLILISLNVLTENQEKAWSFSDEGMNPQWGVSSAELFDTVFLGRAYFVNRSDIIDYANAK
ncbi:hypothetical protein M0Q50_00315 [bacterium]|jgi:hypothetical protein|nr:hypothetical protein [bacterium]